ncbi:MAG TPA: HdeD family acid-resistance protein [Chloroflexia bacterium]|nr:HdeD family acid-resistance protein [Chloroflexia bacterium]
MIDVVTVSARNWWLFVLRGALAVLFAMLALFWPSLAIEALVLLFGAYALVDGVFAVAAGLERIGKQKYWWALVIQGLLGIATGIITFLWPGITALVLLTFIGVWATITGVMEVVAAVQLRKEIEDEWLLGISGVVSVLFGLYVLIFPGLGALSLIWLIATYAFIIGILLIILGFRLRSWQQGSGRAAAPRPI